MNTTRRIGGVLLGPIALLLALPLESGGGVGNGPCTTAYTLYHISGPSGHSFGDGPVCTICVEEEVIPYPYGDPYVQHYFPLGSMPIPECNPGGGGGGEILGHSASSILLDGGSRCAACGGTSTCHQEPMLGPCHVECGGGNLFSFAEKLRGIASDRLWTKTPGPVAEGSEKIHLSLNRSAVQDLSCRGGPVGSLPLPEARQAVPVERWHGR
jgi:hypothetical protein